MDRIILHCDLNAFYASVEIKHNPELRGKAVAVCGSTDLRHGIVLAKSEEAKKLGVSTGETVWQARVKCPNLIIANPRYDLYLKYSRMVRKLFDDYTDFTEPFGLDEAWLDVTGSTKLFGNGEEIAHTIRERIKNEIGITASVGVSFNKIFSKMGSDMKKPDAVTVISRENFKELVWPLPVSFMLGIGNSTKDFLKEYGIFTLGDLAVANVKFLEQKIGKYGYIIWKYANGFEQSPVSESGYSAPLKSVGHGTTTARDLYNDSDIWHIVYELTQDIARKLRENELMATGIRVSVRTSELEITQYQGKLDIPCQCFDILSTKAFELFLANYKWKKPIRSLTVTAIDLVSANIPIQMDFNHDPQKLIRTEKAERAIEHVRAKFGDKIINMCSLYQKSDTIPRMR